MRDTDPYNQEEKGSAEQNTDYLESILGNEEEEFWQDEQEI
jgi:hypothetical protein